MRKPNSNRDYIVISSSDTSLTTEHYTDKFISVACEFKGYKKIMLLDDISARSLRIFREYVRFNLDGTRIIANSSEEDKVRIIGDAKALIIPYYSKDSFMEVVIAACVLTPVYYSYGVLYGDLLSLPKTYRRYEDIDLENLDTTSLMESYELVDRLSYDAFIFNITELG